MHGVPNGCALRARALHVPQVGDDHVADEVRVGLLASLQHVSSMSAACQWLLKEQGAKVHNNLKYWHR